MDRRGLINCFKITTLAVHNLRSRRLVRRLHLLGALLTRAIVELPRISECHSLLLPALRTASGNRYILSSTECEFLRDDSVIFPAIRARERFLRDGIRHVGDRVRDLNSL